MEGDGCQAAGAAANVAVAVPSSSPDAAAAPAAFIGRARPPRRRCGQLVDESESESSSGSISISSQSIAPTVTGQCRRRGRGSSSRDVGATRRPALARPASAPPMAVPPWMSMWLSRPLALAACPIDRLSRTPHRRRHTRRRRPRHRSPMAVGRPPLRRDAAPAAIDHRRRRRRRYRRACGCDPHGRAVWGAVGSQSSSHRIPGQTRCGRVPPRRLPATARAAPTAPAPRAARPYAKAAPTDPLLPLPPSKPPLSRPL